MKYRKVIISILSLILITLFNSPLFASEWSFLTFSTGYEYKKAHIINAAAGAGANYQVKVKVFYGSGTDSGENVYLAGKSRADFGDVRFADNDGVTLLDYWIESKVNGDHAIFWVKVIDDLSTVNRTIYIYYGNPNATSESNVTATFIRVIDGAQPVVGSWHLDEGTGTTAHDTSGKANHGTLLPSGSPPTWVDGKFKKALSFDGVEDYVDVTDFSFGGEVTVCGWVYPTAHQHWHRLLDFGNGPASDNLVISASEGTTGKPVFGVYIGGTGYDAISPDPISLNTWHYLVGVLGGGRLKLYVNGVLKVDMVGPPGLNTLTRVNNWIGRSNWAGDAFFKGLIDEVCVYNRALTEAEISDLYHNHGYTTTAYPGRVLIRKFVSPEPTHGAWGGVESVDNSSPKWRIL